MKGLVTLAMFWALIGFCVFASTKLVFAALVLIGILFVSAVVWVVGEEL